MLDKYDLERVKDQRFYSESQKGFVEIKGMSFNINGEEINLKDVSVLDTEIQEKLSNILQETKTKCRLEKRKVHAFNGKDVFLLGRNADKELVWLGEPSWDCGWYWGFGYIETYLNNRSPDRARDISSHSHFSGLVGKQEHYDFEKQCHRLGEYIHNVYASPELIETTFTCDEGWELSELFEQFYLLQGMAGFAHKEKPGCHITASPVDHGNMKEWHVQINQVMIPKITGKIMEMLSPAEEVKE